MMKKIFLTLFAAFFLLSAQDNRAYAGASDKAKALVTAILGKAKTFTTKEKWQSSLCKKANLVGGKLSLRSGNGIACKETNLAAFALVLCDGYSDFNQSSCAKNAHEIHGDNPRKKAILINVVKNDAKLVGKLACFSASVVPEIGAVIGVACNVVGL